MRSTPELKLGSGIDDGRDRLEVVLPSWLVSIVAHAVLFFVMAMILRGCSSSGTVGPKAGDGAFREIGLHVAPETAEKPADQNAVADPNESLTRDDGTPQPEKSIVTDDSTVSQLLSVPTNSGLPLLGPGLPAALKSRTDAQELIKPSGRRAGGEEASGLGQTTFFDIAAKGNRFVYVVDSSGSMHDHGAIRVAKEELVVSLAALEPTQQFHLLFYNQKLSELTGSGDKPSMQWATDINRTLARQFISGVSADGGTDHMPALKKALRYQPEHLFFLTDADQPILSARELNEIKTANNGRSAIHCIEFGKGPELKADNFLKKLARDNGGTYRYRDVTKFGRR